MDYFVNDAADAVVMSGVCWAEGKITTEKIYRMKHLIISVAMCALAVAAQAQEFERTAHGLRTTVPDKGIDIEVEWYTPRTVRVLKSPHGMQVAKTSLSVIAKPETVEFKTRYDGDGVAEMSSDALTVRIDGRSGVVSFSDAMGG